MLVRPDATFIQQLTGQSDFVFPRGTDWLTFESKFPAHSVFANSVLDSAVGLGDTLGTRVFARADWQNWVSTTKISLYEVGTRVGLPNLEGSPIEHGLANVYDNISATVDVLGRYDDPAEIIPELIKNAGLQVVQQLAGHSNMVGQTVAQVLAAAVWAFDVVSAHRGDLLGKNIALPPLQTEDPATDSWQVNRVFELFRSPGKGGVVYPDGGAEAASNADYTNLFLPAYRSTREWTLQYRTNGVAVQQGYSSEGRGPNGNTRYNFDVGDGSTFGFMPGTTTMLRVLQASYRFYSTVRGSPVNRFTIRCRGNKKACGKMVKSFDGSRDCRQCVDAESVWPTKGIGWAYGGAPLNVTTPGENVGAFYPSTNKLLFNLLQQIARPGPLLFTVDASQMYDQWKQSFERFWIFAAREWHRYRGTAWRGLISRLATLMTCFDIDGEPQLGGRDHRMPLSLIANPREANFEVPFEHSIFSRIIAPFCRDLYKLQRAYLERIDVAYIPPGVGALFKPNGQLRNSQLSDRFVEARAALLKANRRVLLDLRRVSDLEYQVELEAAGVKASPVNSLLIGSPVLGGELQAPKAPKAPKPPRALPKFTYVAPLPPPPKFTFVPPLANAGLLSDHPARGSVPGSGETASPASPDPSSMAPGSSSSRKAGIALGLAATGVTVAAGVAGVARLVSEDRHKP